MATQPHSGLNRRAFQNNPPPLYSSRPEWGGVNFSYPREVTLTGEQEPNAPPYCEGTRSPDYDSAVKEPADGQPESSRATSERSREPQEGVGLTLGARTTEILVDSPPAIEREHSH